VAQAAEALDGNEVALLDVHLADAVEDGDAGAQERGDLDGVDVGRNADNGLGPEEDVLRVAAILRDAIDGDVVATLELAALARTAGLVMAWEEKGC
jgi:hypothetical protein